MSTRLEELLALPSNLDLCCGLDALLRERFQDDLTAIPSAGKWVVWSLAADGIIGNGGFQFLFERWSSPSFYEDALAGFRAIGASKCAAAMAEALEWFPKGKPPVDRDRRLRRWRRCDWEWEQATVRRFWAGSQEVPALLAAFIRTHREEFERMLAGPERAADRTGTDPGTSSPK